MAPQPVDDPMTGSIDEIMTGVRIGAPSARRPTRRSKAPPMDPRRAPGRRALCRQGAQSEKSGSELRSSRRAVEPASAHDRRNCRDRGCGHPHRGGSAVTRMQHDQAADAPLQRIVAGRQVVSVHPSQRRSRLPAAHQISGAAGPGRQLFRPIRLGRGGQSYFGNAAESIPEKCRPQPSFSISKQQR